MFNFDLATEELHQVMNTWTYERALLIQRISQLKGEQSGALSKASLDNRFDMKMEALRQDMMRR